MEKLPKKQYILAVEQTPSKLKQIVKALSKTMGSGKVKDVVAEEAFLYKEITVCLEMVEPNVYYLHLILANSF